MIHRSKIFSPIAALIHADDTKTISGACWVLYLITEDQYKKIQEVFQTGNHPRIVDLLLYNENEMITPTLKFIFNIAGSVPHRNSLLDAGVVSSLNILNSPMKPDFGNLDNIDIVWMVFNRLYQMDTFIPK